MQKILFRTPNIIKILIIFGLIVYTIYSLFFSNALLIYSFSKLSFFCKKSFAIKNYHQMSKISNFCQRKRLLLKLLAVNASKVR